MGSFNPSMFATKEAQEMRDHFRAIDYIFDQGQYNLYHMKPTQLLTDAVMRAINEKCNHDKG